MRKLRGRMRVPTLSPLPAAGLIPVVVARAEERIVRVSPAVCEAAEHGSEVGRGCRRVPPRAEVQVQRYAPVAWRPRLSLHRPVASAESSENYGNRARLATGVIRGLVRSPANCRVRVYRARNLR